MNEHKVADAAPAAPKAKKANKYAYLFILQGNYGYGHGFEDLTASESWKEIRENRKEYRENSPEGSYKIIRRRENNPEFVKS